MSSLIVMNGFQIAVRRDISMKSYRSIHLVKSSDLNHHGTLFAGRMAEWFVESCFACAATEAGDPKSVVCLKIHGLQFRKPIRSGSVISIDARLVRAGTTSMTVYGRIDVMDKSCGDSANESQEPVVDGFITFINVDDVGMKKAHHISDPVPQSEYEESIKSESLNLI
jgi:acyl-CoA hydrolase